MKSFIGDRYWKIKIMSTPVVNVARIFSVVLIGILVLGQGTPQPRTVEAERFVLLDKLGRSRAELYMLPDGSPELSLRDNSGRRRMSLLLFMGELPQVSFKDSKGETRLSLGLLNNELPALTLHDGTKKIRLSIGLLRDGSPDVSLNSKEGEPRASLSVIEDQPSVSLCKGEGGGDQYRTYLGIDSLQVRGEDGKSGVWVSLAPPDSTAEVRLLDKNGRMVLKTK